MGQINYTINEYGEIIREDYFFSQVKGTTPQVLPTNRKVWKIWLLSFLTLGIYGVVVMFAMAKETNISCAEDGKHTRGFWGAIFLSIITLGIYGFVWYYKWANREYEYLTRNRSQGGILSGGSLVFLMLITFILSFASRYASTIAMILYVAQIIWGIFVMSRYVKQHNTVNKIYNLNTFGQKA
ncbi:MAG: DUF4234 domain-containing protein [Alistipes sp.]|nr:DUF4234 domain-containing protein [Alistipes sp.]MBO7282690.1 DUF4234 domain-containing protein [Alistipes sp.]